MNEHRSITIRITDDELRDPSIDEALAKTQETSSTGPGPIASSAKRRLIYSTWFYLMLAGALGAFLAWAVIEPGFDDAVRFTGRVETVSPDETLPLAADAPIAIRGKLVVSGVTVFTIADRTHVMARPGSRDKIDLAALHQGDIVSVSGEPLSNRQSTMLTTLIVRQPPGTPIDVVDIAAAKVSTTIFAFLLFPVVAALVGLMVGGVEGAICRTFTRAAWCAAIGFAVGLIGGALSTFAAGLVYGLLSIITANLDPTRSLSGFLFQMFQRGLAWTIAGMAMGLGQGFALKSSQLKLNGFIGGMVGGLIGGLLFDPLNLVLTDDTKMQGAELSRAVGLTIIGAVVGLMIGLTDMLTRTAWLKVLKGPLAGKEFTFYKTPIRLGSSPKSEIYLFKDPKIAPVHAEINSLRDTYELSDSGSMTGTVVNGRPIVRHRLSDGDRIQIGDSEFRYTTSTQHS